MPRDKVSGAAPQQDFIRRMLCEIRENQFAFSIAFSEIANERIIPLPKSKGVCCRKHRKFQSGNRKAVFPFGRRLFCFWCGRWDLNPHVYGRTQAPQACLSAYSSTPADQANVIIAALSPFVNAQSKKGIKKRGQPAYNPLDKQNGICYTIIALLCVSAAANSYKIIVAENRIKSRPNSPSIKLNTTLSGV